MNKIILALIALFTISNLSANDSLDKAVIIARDKGAPIVKVTEATVEALKDNSSPVEVFYIIVTQRRNWSTDELYAIFDTILTYSNLKKDVSKNYGYLEVNLEGAKLIRALHEYVADDDKFKQIMYRILSGPNTPKFNGGPNTSMIPGSEKRDLRPFPVPVTPDPISPQN